MGFNRLDLLVLIIYLAGVTYFGLKAAGRQRHTTDYFLGGRQIPWWAVLLSVVATETSTLTFISIPAVAYKGNLTFLQITFGYIIGRTVVSFVFLPRFFKGEMATAYEFLGQRFGLKLRRLTSATFMVTRVLADGVRLFASAIPLVIILRLAGFKWPALQVYFLAIIVITAVTLIYTYKGGIKAVVWMDVVQWMIYIGGALAASGIILSRLSGSWSSFGQLVRAGGKLQLIYTGFNLSLADFLAEPYTLITAVVGGAIFSVASHGTDQLIVQRLLATRNLRSSQKALITSGFLVCFQYALFLGIGLLLFGFYSGRSPASLGLATADEVFARFIVEHIPAGLAGLIVAAILAAAMSTLSSSINSLASTTMLDLYKPLRGKSLTPQRELKLSRWMTFGWGMVLAGAALIFALLQVGAGRQRPAVVELGLGIASYTYGGLLGVFLLGLLFKKVGQREAVVGFGAGLLVLLFLVKGPVQEILPGEGWSLAWTLYILIGSLVVIGVGLGLTGLRKVFVSKRDRE